MKQIFLIFLPLLVFISDGCSFEETPPRPECEFVDFIATIQLADAKTANLQTGKYVGVRNESGFCRDVPYQAKSAKSWLAPYQDILNHKPNTSDRFAVQLNVRFKDCETKDGSLNIRYDLDLSNPDHKETFLPGRYEMKVKVPKNYPFTMTVDFIDVCSDCAGNDANCKTAGAKTGRMNESAEKMFKDAFIPKHQFDLKYTLWYCNNLNNPKEDICD